MGQEKQKRRVGGTGTTGWVSKLQRPIQETALSHQSQIKTFEGFGNPRVAAKDKVEALEYFYMKCTDVAATKCKMIIDIVGELLKKPTAYFQEQR